MRAFLRAKREGQVDEHALHGPLTGCLAVVADHLGGSTRTTFDKMAKLDRERTPGEHAFDRRELLELVAMAHALLAAPPDKLRRLRRVPEGPLPTAERIGLLRDWLQVCCESVVIYDLWRSVRESDQPGS
jgi:hypothetical protein